VSINVEATKLKQDMYSAVVSNIPFRITESELFAELAKHFTFSKVQIVKD